MKIGKIVFLLLLLVSTINAKEWLSPMPLSGVEIGSENLVIPATAGLAKTKNDGLVGSGTYFIGRLDSSYMQLYFCAVGTVWIEPEFGGTVGLALMATKQVLETKKSEVWSGAKFYISPFVAISITNKEQWLPTFGIKLIAVNK